MADHYRQRIATGDLAPGQKFPSVREIAGEWKTTANTVHRAVRLLRDEGWIEVSQGRVPTVIGVPAVNPPP